MIYLLTFLIAAPVLALGLLYKRKPKQLSYRQERNGSWIAEERPLFGIGVLTTWREATGGDY